MTDMNRRRIGRDPRLDGRKPSASELDVLFRIKRRVQDILTSHAFHGQKCSHRLVVSPEEAEVIRSNIERGNLHPHPLKVSTPGFVCSLAGVWILEKQE